MNGWKSRIKSSKVSKYPSPSKWVKKPRLRLVFATHFSVFGHPDEKLFLVFDILLQSFRLQINLPFRLQINLQSSEQDDFIHISLPRKATQSLS